MKKEYDFSKWKERRNPYAEKKKAVGIHLSPKVLDYFKELAAETGLPYPKLIDLYLLDCARRRRKLAMNWVAWWACGTAEAVPLRKHREKQIPRVARDDRQSGGGVAEETIEAEKEAPLVIDNRRFEVYSSKSWTGEFMSSAKTAAKDSIVIPALRARSSFGRLLNRVDKEGRSLVIEKRGTPRAILLSIRDYVRLAAPEPEVLRAIGEESTRKGTASLSTRQIDTIIRAARSSKKAARKKQRLERKLHPRCTNERK
jgi:prevent-host-death family protein